MQKSNCLSQFIFIVMLIMVGNTGIGFAEPMSGDALKAYKYSESRKAFSALEESIRTANPEQVKEYEKLLTDVINADDATFEAKQLACKILRRVASEASLPTLTKLLRDEKLSNMARYVLQSLSSPKVDEILRTALKEFSGNLRIGVIGTIAQRGDRTAVPQIALLLKSDDPLLAQTAVKALGQIGGTAAAEALAQTELPAELQSLGNDSLLLCADQMNAAGETAPAKSIYTKLTDKKYPSPIRIAAYRGIIRIEKENAIPTLLTLLKDEDVKLQAVAAGPLFALIPGSKVVQSITEAFPNFSPDTQSRVLTALAARGDKSAVPAIVKAVSSENETVKIAAVSALGCLGDADCIQLLAETAVAGGKVGVAAEQSLNQLKNVDAAIIQSLKTSAKQLAPVLIRSLTARRSVGAIPVLTAFALDSDAGVRKESIQGLTQLCRGENLPQLLQLIPQLNNKADIQAVENAIITVGKTMDADRRTEGFLAPLKEAPVSLRISLMRLLGEFGGEKAADAVKQVIANDAEENVRAAAVQALVSWPDASPYSTLLSLAKNAPNPEKRQAALKGVLRMIDLSSSDSIQQNIEKYQTAMQVAGSAEEKRMVIKAAANRTNTAVLDFLEKFLQDSEVGKDALEAYKKVVKQAEISDTDSSKWKVTASSNRRQAQNAVDGKPDTRWDTGAEQKPGQWFQIDLGADRVVEQIQLDTTGSNGDYPRQYAVYVSIDGDTWGTPVVEGKGDGAITEIKIPSKNARFVKIVQNGVAEGTFWSIHELTMKISLNKEKLNHAYEVLKKFEKN